MNNELIFIILAGVAIGIITQQQKKNRNQFETGNGLPQNGNGYPSADPGRVPIDQNGNGANGTVPHGGAYRNINARPGCIYNPPAYMTTKNLNINL